MKNLTTLLIISASLALPACKGSVSGQAFMQDDFNQRVEGVVMLFEKDGTTEQEQAVTGPGGTYSIDLDTGPHHLRVIHPVYSQCNPGNPNLVVVQPLQTITVNAILCE